MGNTFIPILSILPAFCYRDMTIYFVPSAFISSQISMKANTEHSPFTFKVRTLHPNVLISSR